MAEVAILRNRIEAALDQRGRRYAHVFSFYVRFEADDTSAEKDSSNFEDILKMLGLPEAKKIIISPTDKIPGWTITGCIRDMLQERVEKAGRALIIGHYAGHGGLSTDNQLYFAASTANQTRIAMYQPTFGHLMDPSGVPPETDVCVIIDSCFSGAVTRGSQPANFTAELVASVGPQQTALGNWSALARLQNKTFTSRLADEIAKEVGKGASGIILSDIISNLRQTSSPDRMPIYHLKEGLFGNRIPNLKTISMPPHLRPTTQ